MAGGTCFELLGWGMGGSTAPLKLFEFFHSKLLSKKISENFIPEIPVYKF
jgi:hypothetical protein